MVQRHKVRLSWHVHLAADLERRRVRGVMVAEQEFRVAVDQITKMWKQQFQTFDSSTFCSNRLDKFGVQIRGTGTCQLDQADDQAATATATVNQCFLEPPKIGIEHSVFIERYMHHVSNYIGFYVGRISKQQFTEVFQDVRA